MENVPFQRGPLLALGTVAVYVTVIATIATLSFRRRDIAGTS